MTKIYPFVKGINTWAKMTEGKYRGRVRNIYKLLKFPTSAAVVADIGCGAHAGIFSQFQYPTMYAVDPGWGAYKKKGLAHIPNRVTEVQCMSHDMVLPKKCDFIVTVNAIDHSGNIKKNLTTVMDNIKEGGDFYLHTHMRVKKQLDYLHRIELTEEILDDALSDYTFVRRDIYKSDPLFPPAKRRSHKRDTYVAVVRKK